VHRPCIRNLFFHTLVRARRFYVQTCPCRRCINITKRHHHYVNIICIIALSLLKSIPVARSAQTHLTQISNTQILKYQRPNIQTSRPPYHLAAPCKRQMNTARKTQVIVICKAKTHPSLAAASPQRDVAICDSLCFSMACQTRRPTHFPTTLTLTFATPVAGDSRLSRAGRL
jgi:hypothetical protein